GKIAVDRITGSALPYGDNLVNLLVAESDEFVPHAEIVRVLVPDGIAWIRADDDWLKITKPRPAEMDDWKHFLKSPDNNPVSHDTLVGPPDQIQWMATPRFSRAHEQQASFSTAVTDAGRMFYILDDAPRVDIRLPSEWFVIARDAFNGIELWRLRMGDWVNQYRRFRSGPANLPFRLVAADGKVFVTMAFTDPVSVLDAATGETIRTIPNSEMTKQIIYEDGVLTLLIDKDVDRMEEIDAARRRGDFMKHDCRIMKVQVDSGEAFWEREIDELVFPCMALKGGRVFAQTPTKVFALDFESGSESWSADFEAQLPISKGKINSGEMQWESPSIVVNDRVILAADFKKVQAYSVEDGTVLWEGNSKQEYNAPPDLMLVGKDLWMRGNGARVALDPLSGEVKVEHKTPKPYMHPRCYRGKVVGDYLLFGEMGVQMVDIKTGEVRENDWIRGTCQYGVMPANGLLYVPPDSCACNMKTKLSGIYAFASSVTAAAAADGPEPVSGPRLERKSEIRGQKSDSTGDWPTFRASPSRSGIAKTEVPTELGETWKVEIGGRLSSPVIAGGTVFVAAIDEHTIHALDSTTGKASWTFTAGGRIDSPPTIHKGGVYFGSADGWVYALNASDGKLAWRYRAAPEERFVMIKGQLESAWPVHGAVLIQNDELVVSAGRSSYLDSGIHFSKLDPATGELIEEKTIWSPDEKTGVQHVPGPGEDRKDVRGVLSDILVADGADIYMRHLRLDLKTGSDDTEPGVHLFTPIGMLDDTWWHRAYWVVHDRFTSHWSGWWKVGNQVASGRILSYDEGQIYGFGRDKYPGGNTGQWRGGERYQLFAYDRNQETKPVEVVDRKGKKGKAPPAQPLKYRWTTDSPLLATSLVATEKTIFIAGPPDEFSPVGDGDAALELKEVEKALSSWRGESGGILYAAAADDGAELARIELSAPTVFDGMAAADQRLFLSLQDGSIICLSK
ncbi:MAG: outer membrane protein assembly factor BamB, partial [Verrucomicrobiales bacterium]